MYNYYDPFVYCPPHYEEVYFGNYGQYPRSYAPYLYGQPQPSYHQAIPCAPLSPTPLNIQESAYLLTSPRSVLTPMSPTAAINDSYNYQNMPLSLDKSANKHFKRHPRYQNKYSRYDFHDRYIQYDDRNTYQKMNSRFQDDEYKADLKLDLLYKTELCKKWLEFASCPYSDRCRFAHGKRELRKAPRPKNYRTQLCDKWKVYGTCPYGERCMFLHDDQSRIAEFREGILDDTTATHNSKEDTSQLSFASTVQASLKVSVVYSPDSSKDIHIVSPTNADLIETPCTTECPQSYNETKRKHDRAILENVWNKMKEEKITDKSKVEKIDDAKNATEVQSRTLSIMKDLDGNYIEEDGEKVQVVPSRHILESMNQNLDLDSTACHAVEVNKT